LHTTKAEIPDYLTSQCRALGEDDPHNTKPAFDVTASNPVESDAQQTIKVGAKEDEHGKGSLADAEKCSVKTHVSSSEPYIKNIIEDRTDNSNRDTKVSQPITSNSSAAREASVSRDKAAGNKRRSSGRVHDVVKKVKTEQGSTEPECPTFDRTLPRVKSEGEGESTNDFVRVKHEERKMERSLDHVSRSITMRKLST
jgi:hypothetical protein